MVCEDPWLTGSTTMAATCAVNRFSGANALPGIDVAWAAVGTWAGSAVSRESKRRSFY